MRRAQAFTLDLMLAVLILIVGSVIIITSFATPEPRSFVREDSATLASAIFEPYPRAWNSSSVIRPGFVVDHKVNDTLLAEFIALPPDTVQDLLSIKSYFVVRVNASVLSFPVSYGHLVVEPPDNIHVVHRYAAYNGSIASITVETWE